jgi:dihydrofolate reductase
VREAFERTGASVMGRRTVDVGERAWPEDAPFHTPFLVVTHEERDPWERPGGATILQCVNAGLVDELSIALSPVLFGSGIRLFDGVNGGRVALEPVRAEPSPRVTHLTYAVRER